jgi:hypothetical protein
MLNRLENLEANFWTLTKNMDDIKVDEETKKQIEALREKARIVSSETALITSKFVINENNEVVVTKEDKAAFDKKWDEMADIRRQIEVLIKKKRKI